MSRLYSVTACRILLPNPNDAMNAKLLLLAGLTTAMNVGALSARVWTSADGEKTFVGDYNSFDPDQGKVTVTMKNGRSVTFALDMLSEDDRKWIEARFEEENAPDPAEILAAQKIGAGLTKAGVLQKLDGKRFANYEFQTAPEYYILYFSASW